MANKKKNSASKKLFSAVAMLTCSAVMLSTATYAWFTMNKTVKVDGMEVKTKVGSNLMISETNASDAYYGTVLVQGKQALLEPVSTTTALNDAFWYTVDAKSDGSKLHEATGANVYKQYTEAVVAEPSNAALDATYSKKSNYDPLFNSTYEITPAATAFGTAYGYIDYDFYIKATGDTSKAQYINMTKCNLTYNNAAISNASDKAWRVGVFAVSTASATQNVDAIATGNLKSILRLSGATYHNNGAVTAANGTYTAATNLDTAVNIGNVAAGGTAYYKVTVRLWLEGQDTKCTSETYAALNDSWKLDLEFQMQDATGGVTNIETGARPNPALVDDVPDAS